MGNFDDDPAPQEVWVAPEPMLVAPVASWKIARWLEDIAAFNASWSRLRDLQPERLERMKHDAVIESVGASTRIEGAALSDTEVAEVLRGLHLDTFSERDEQEVRGYRDLLELIHQEWRSIPLTENYVKQLHARMLAHATKDSRHRGEYKASENSVVAKHPDGSESVVFRTASPFDTRRWIGKESRGLLPVAASLPNCGSGPGRQLRSLAALSP
ncbi:MAG: hypothetical protein LC797_12035 [Chloroflexi bacterium]|nr:hypothetical protein [Chloroflexota bacterium]